MDYLKLLLLIAIVNVVIPQNALSARLGRQEDEDGDLPEIALPILQIIGSALAGNASALIDNSIALIPSEISDTISSAINVLANAINSAKPPETTTKGSAQDSSSTTAAATPTTTEEDEDQEPTTPGVDLRGNSSDATTTTTTSLLTQPTSTAEATNSQVSTTTTPVINILNTDESVTNHVDVTASAAVTERLATTAAPAPTTSSTQRSVINLDNPTTAAAISVSIEHEDSDNKANWISLISEPEVSSSLLPNATVPGSLLSNVLILPSDVGQDNKANWASIFNSADLLQPAETTTTRTNIRGNNKQAGAGLGHDIVSSNRPLTSHHPSRNPVKNIPTWLLSSSASSSSSNTDVFKNKLISVLPSQQHMPQTLNYSTQVLQSFQKVSELLSTSRPTSPPAPLAVRLPGGQTLIQLNPALLALLNATSANGWNYNQLEKNGTTTTESETSSTTPSTVTSTSSTSTTEDDDDDDDDNYDV